MSSDDKVRYSVFTSYDESKFGHIDVDGPNRSEYSHSLELDTLTGSNGLGLNQDLTVGQSGSDVHQVLSDQRLASLL